MTCPSLGHYVQHSLQRSKKSITSTVLNYDHFHQGDDERLFAPLVAREEFRRESLLADLGHPQRQLAHLVPPSP